MPLKTSPSRRTFLTLTAGAGLASVAHAGEAPTLPARPDIAAQDLAANEAYWAKIAAQYSVTPAIHNIENGYWGIMAAPVMSAYRAHTEKVNRENTYYARGAFNQDIEKVYARLARFLDVAPDELLLTRGASEALQILIGGYNKLKPGDAVLYADLDYSAMKSAIQWLADRRGVKVIKINLPEPASRDNIIDAYARAFEAHPNLKMALVTHVNNLTGLIHPVREIAALAKSHGIDIILDSAHAIGQIDFDLSALGVDFVGINLHKWIGAPIGCGLAYIKKPRIPDIDRFMNEPGAADNIRARAHTGTLNFAAHLTIPDALDFHEAIGIDAKEARLRYLRNLWVGEARANRDVQILTPDDPTMVAAMTSFRYRNRRTTEENNAIAHELAEKHGLFTVRRTGPAAGDCIRVTPALYNSAQDMARIAPALKALA
jgi:selenocysteine lyase/cysteine desulfurase